MSSFQIHQATRSGVIPLVSCFGPSGSGKTMSALLYMRGIVGPKGRITLVDSESGRGSLFADVIPGGYSVLDLDAPFSPDRYFEAFDVAEKSSDGIVIDSMSHAHNGEGGILDMQEEELNRMAGDNYGKREACKLGSWIKPKMAMKRFIGRVLRAKVPLICCLRGEPKTHMVKNDQGKNTVVTDQFSTPIFDSKFIYELLLNLETYSKNGQGGYVIPRKITHPSLAGLLPKENEQVGIAHGTALAKWCAGSPDKSVTATVTQTTDVRFEAVDTKSVAALKRKLWDLTGPFHFGSKTKLEQWLHDELFIQDDESLATLTEKRLAAVIESINHKLKPTT